MTRTTMAALPMVEAVEGVSRREISDILQMKESAGQLTHSHHVTGHIVAEGKIASDGHYCVNDTS